MRVKKGKRERTDREKLGLFLRRVQELRQTRMVIEGVGFSHRVHYEQGQFLQSTLEQPEEAILKEYLLTFRHFVAEGEDTFIERIFSICYKCSISDEVKRNVEGLREVYKQVRLGTVMPLVVNGKRLTPLQITDMYLNGKYFHNDLECEQILDSLEPLFANTFRAYFLNFVMVAGKIVAIVANNIVKSFQEGLFVFEKDTDTPPGES